MRKKSTENTYITKSMLPETDNLITWPNNQTNTEFRYLENGQTLDTLCKALPGVIDNDAVIPNMLMPAYRLEGRMHCNTDAEAANALQDDRVKEWLRVLCAVLFNDDQHLQYHDVELNQVVGNANSPMILRVLAKTLTEAGNSVPTFRLFMQRTGPGNDDFKPIGFTYSGLKIGVCPVVELNLANFAGAENDPQGWLNCDDPVAYLNEVKNQIYRARINDYLSYDGNDQHAYGVLDAEYNKICKEIRRQLMPINGQMAAFFPRRIGGNVGNQPTSYIQWFTDSILCVRCAQTGEGVIAVSGKDYKCVLPIRQSCINNNGDIQTICTSAAVTADGDDLIASFSYNGIVNQRRYTIGEQIQCDNPLNSVMLWPNATYKDNGWDRYFSYLNNDCHGQAADNLYLFSMDVYAGGVWHSQTYNRNLREVVETEQNTVRIDYLLDSVVETATAPTAISLKCENNEAGMLVPQLRHHEDGKNVQPIGQLGVDFGTTNTIAYFCLNGNAPDAVTISDSRKVLLHVNSNNDVVLPFLFAPEDAGDKVPYKTAVQVFPAQQPKAFINVIAPLQYRVDLNDDIRKLLSLKDDLKWPSNPAEANFQGESAAFLEYIMLLLLWEIRKEYGTQPNKYVFTYPGAMPITYIQALTKSVMKTMPSVYRNNPRMYYATEASVVVDYLIDPVIQQKYNKAGFSLVNRTTGYLLMDIGGGSVDVSLWQEQDSRNVLCAEFSIASFAGNKIQMEQVHPDPSREPRLELLAQIMGYTQNELDNATENRPAVDFYRNVQSQNGNIVTEESFRQQWNAYIDTIRDGMQDRTSDAAAPKRRMYRKTLEMYFHFMFFLNGYVFGKSLQDKLYIKKDGTFSIVMGGNGSKMYDLCGDTVYDSFDKINRRMFGAGITYAGCGESLAGLSVPILPAIMHKHEVAFGASKYIAPPPRPKVHGAFTLEEDDASTAANAPMVPEWLNAKDADPIWNETKSFFECFMKSLNKAVGCSDYMKNSFGFQLDDGFYCNTAQPGVQNNAPLALPQAAAEVFRKLLMEIGNRCF